MQLSIGMIVKNEEKYLGRCLCALDRLRKEVECELIIVDTGSDDSTVEIAKKFTDKVYHFTWCNDFSAARNEALKHASGEWYMGLDADEIFMDTDDIISFFRSGDYMKFSSASFVIRNYSDENKTDASDFDAIRMVRRADDLHYEGVIHEHFVSSQLNMQSCARLASVAEHYGYVVDDGILDKKTERNRELLYSRFEERKNEAVYYTQLYDLEYGAKDYEKAAEYARECIRVSENESENAVGYMLYLKILNAMGRSEEVLYEAEKYFSQKHTQEHRSELSIYMNRGLARFRLNDWHGAIADFEKYFGMLEKDDNGTDSYIHPIEDTTKECFIIRFLECAAAYEQVGDAASLSRHLKSVSPEEFDRQMSLDIDYAREYVAHAVLLAVHGGDRSAADYVANNGTERQRQLLREIIAEATADSQQSEMEQHAEKVKTAIRTMINSGMKKQATELIEQYKQLCPDDDEILQLEKLI